MVCALDLPITDLHLRLTHLKHTHQILKKLQKMSKAIGIDLGTTYSCVAVFQHNIVEIIADDQGHRTTSSFIAFNGNKRLIGEAAKAQAVYNPENTVFDVKRLIGRRFLDETVQADIKHFPFTVVNQNESPVVKVDFKGEEKLFHPEEISAFILGKMKDIAESYLGSVVTDAVITVPAYFNDSQRQATKDAGTIAGLNVLRIINEPTAAAIAYGLDKKSVGEKNVLIFDLGGGTFDVSILSIDEGVFEVKATCGDSHLGGEDFDNRLVNYFVNEFLQKHGKDISKDKRALRKLKSTSEQVKRSLSSTSQASVEVDSLFSGIDFTATITRAKFEDLCIDLFRNTLEPVKKALEDSELDKSEIDEIILVGGSTRIPKIQRLLQEFFDGKVLNKSINPDEAVAYGAAVQAAILSGETTDLVQDLLLLDVLPLSLGIEQSSGLVSKFINANTTIPTENQQYFTTSHDEQEKILFPIYEGERPLARDNHCLGQFVISGIRPAPRGVARVLITFRIDANGILQVSAEDAETGSKSEVTIKNENGRLSEADITKMKHEAEVYFVEDQLEVERIKAMQTLEHYCSQLVSTIDEPSLSEKLPREDRQFIEKKVAQTYLWMESNSSATKEVIVKEHKEMELVCNGLIKLYC